MDFIDNFNLFWDGFSIFRRGGIYSNEHDRDSQQT